MGIVTDEWKNKYQVISDSLIPNLKRTATYDGWDAGALSRIHLPTLQPAGMSWVTRELNTNRMCGLSADFGTPNSGVNVDANQSYTDIDLAWFALGDGTLQVYESGVLKYNPDPRPTYSAGDILEIQLEYKAENLSFSDDFNDNSIDPLKWVNPTPTGDGSVLEQNQRLELRGASNAPGYATIDSVPINLVGKTIVVDVNPPSWASGASYSYHENYFQVIKASGQQFFLYFGGGSGLARIYDNGTYYQVGFSPGSVTKFRFRHDILTNTLFLDIFYANGQGWYNLMNRVLTYSLDGDTHIHLDAGQYTNSGYQPFFFIDNVKIVDTGSGWSANYYHTPFGGARILRYVSEKDIPAMFPNMRIDTSIFHQNGTIENVQYLGNGWSDEKGISKFPSRLNTPQQQVWKKVMSGYFGGGNGSGPVVPPVTQGQIYPRGIKS